ncbi:MAG: hypothetical protein JWM28_597 [Chitinophagaceae bacterium]|nr:hypothetical protein [Chitinophagaceae bacterium]
MNTNVMPSHVQLDKMELKKLLTEVKETFAKEKSARQSFGQVDIWNIRRSMKTARTLWDK